jgi:hypothetical protein
MSRKQKKIKIPKSVLDLRMSPNKFAKKNDIRIKGKGLRKSEKKRNLKRLKIAYSEAALSGLNKAVKILVEVPKENKKTDKIKDGVDNIIVRAPIMKKIAKLYNKDPKNYQNMKFLPGMIMNTIEFYSQEGLSDSDKEKANSMNVEELVLFCSKILKKVIKRYKRYGFSDDAAYKLATVVPTAKNLKDNRALFKRLITALYDIAEKESIDISSVFDAILKIDKKKVITRRDLEAGFYSEFILSKSSNKNHGFNDTQKELRETLIERCLEYLNNIKGRQCRDILRTYIKRRKTAESYKNDTRRIIKFIDHANSNSPYINLKAVIQDLVSDNSSNELYLS